MNLLNEIKKHEGFKSNVYQCTEGYDTIGYGFAIKDLVLDEDIADFKFDTFSQSVSSIIKNSKN